jgi:large subunit ribosomal protein L3
MINTILGSKLATGQVFIEGQRVPVTKITAGPCIVTQIKKETPDGYWAVQLGFSTRKAKNTTKSLQGHLKTAKTENNFPRHLKEVRLDKEPELKVGDIVKISDIFNTGDVVAVSGISKGKGFAGVVKRHHFRGGPRTRGRSDRERAPGSIGQTTTPGRVYRGKKMGGRMGSEEVTVKNLHVVGIDEEKNEMAISGHLPGNPGTLLTIIRIKKGSLKELEHETVATVVEGEPEAPAAEGEQAQTAEAPKAEAAAPAQEGGQANG